MSKDRISLSKKDRELWETIRRRTIFRDFRNTLRNIGISVWVPFNSAQYTSEYCKMYGDPSCEPLKEPPVERRRPNNT